MEPYKYSDEYINNLSKELKEWALLDTSTAFCQFLASKNLSYANHYYFRNKSEVYTEAIESVRPHLAARLRASLESKDKLIMMELGHHDQFYHEYTEGLKDTASARTKDQLSGLTLSDLIRKIKSGEIDISNYED